MFAAWVMCVTRFAMKRDELGIPLPSDRVVRQSEVGIALKVELNGEGKTRLESGYA